MSDNPYQSPADSARNRWFRPWRLILATIIFLALVAGPLAWQAARERRARRDAKRNLDQLRQAFEAYQQRSAGRISDIHEDGDEQHREAD